MFHSISFVKKKTVLCINPMNTLTHNTYTGRPVGITNCTETDALLLRFPKLAKRTGHVSRELSLVRACVSCFV